MRSLLTAIIVCLSAILTSCETLPERAASIEPQAGLRLDKETASLLVGVWYGKYDREPGELVEFITRHDSDGTFTIRFRTTGNDGSVIEHNEKGRWQVRGDIITKRTTDVDEDGILPSLDELGFYNDEYRIVSLTRKSIEYEHIEYRIVYTAIRVANDFDFPPLKNTVKAGESAVRPQTKPAIFTDQARSYVENAGRIFVDRFDQICSATRLELSSIASQADSLEWNIGQTRPSEKNIRRWTSFSPFDENQSEQSEPIFILDVVLNKLEESHATSCGLTMWGTSSLPEIGEQEFNLIAKDVLPPMYIIGNTDQQSHEERLPFSSDKIQFTTYSAELTKPAGDDLRYFYRWVGGTHSLVAAKGS